MNEDNLKPCFVCENDKGLITANEKTPIGVFVTVTCPKCLASARLDDWNNVLRADQVSDSLNELLAAFEGFKQDACECAQVLGDALGKPVKKPEEYDGSLFLTLAKELAESYGKLNEKLYNKN